MIESIINFLNGQPMFTGLVGATLVASLMFLARKAPKAIFDRLRELFTVTLVIEERQEAFLFVTAWLADHSAVGRARRLMMTEAYDYAESRWRWKMTLGRGWHLLRYGGAWLLINREVQEGGELAQALGGGKTHRLWLMSIGRSQTAIRDLIETARTAYFGDGLINIHVYSSGWVSVDRRHPRSIDTVFMPPAQKTRVVDDIRRFLASQQIYASRGVPWRRGYLFKGPPGTGKTTLIFACAGLLGRPIYALNLNNIRGDNELISAFNQTDRDGIIVIEDIDTVKIAGDRELAAENSSSPVPTTAQEQRITLSGLLNAIDGLAAREGRLLFITSNHADKLDPALLRPGRIDVTEEIDRLHYAEACAMVDAFGADRKMLADIALPIAAAELQGMLLGEHRPARHLVAVA